MPNNFDWGTLKQRLVAGVSLLIVASLWTFASTRASSEDVDILADKITADVNEIKEQHKEDTEKMVKTLHAIDAKSSAIAVILDRIDKQAGGPGMPPETLTTEPVE